MGYVADDTLIRRHCVGALVVEITGAGSVQWEQRLTGRRLDQWIRNDRSWITLEHLYLVTIHAS